MPSPYIRADLAPAASVRSILTRAPEAAQRRGTRRAGTPTRSAGTRPAGCPTARPPPLVRDGEVESLDAPPDEEHPPIP